MARDILSTPASGAGADHLLIVPMTSVTVVKVN